MEKIFLLIAFFAFTTGMNAQIKYFKAIAMSVEVDNESSGWKDINVIIQWDYDKERVVIYSNEKQTIDYEYIEKKYDNGAIDLIYRGTDSKYNKLLLIYRYFPNGQKFISIVYTDEVCMCIYKIRAQ